MIEVVNRRERLALDQRGRVCRIVSLLDDAGERTDDADAAVIAVVRLAEGGYVWLLLSEFPQLPLTPPS